MRALRSSNVHEIRGYNRAAGAARGALLAFSQDDRLPPASVGWVDAVAAAFDAFDASASRLDALGLHRGSAVAWCGFGVRPCAKGHTFIGSCADTTASGRAWAGLRTGAMPDGAPLAFTAFANIGPLVVRAGAFAAVGGFDSNYSREGAPGLGFDAEFTARLWAQGYAAAVVCTSNATHFRNGCGGKGSMHSRERELERQTTGKANMRRFSTDYETVIPTIETHVRDAQRALRADLGEARFAISGLHRLHARIVASRREPRFPRSR